MTSEQAIKITEPRMLMRNGLLVPRRVTIETVFGCNLHCVMCPIDDDTERRKGLMPMPLFERIIRALAPYTDDIEMMDLYSLGEPLLDKHIFDRIRHAKSHGFRDIGISTNADLLDAEKRRALLESGIDRVVFSIDGATKPTHDAIRVGSNFDRVVANCLSFIAMRDDGGYSTSVHVRFIRQDANRAEWEAFKILWLGRINKSEGDCVSVYDAHSWGGERSDTPGGIARNAELDKAPCYVISDVLYILADGTVPLCHQDWLHPVHNFGNAGEQDPIAVFNSLGFERVRELHFAGRKCIDMDMCRDCTIHYSDQTKQRF